MTNIQQAQRLHRIALAKVKLFKQSQAHLIETLQQIDATKAFQILGYSSLFNYSVKALGLSESMAYNFMAVSRKAKQVPELNEAIKKGELTVNKARRISSVITSSNHREWIQKAKVLPQLALEQAVAKLRPKPEPRAQIKAISGERKELRLGISNAIHERIDRLQALLSQKKRRQVTLEETIDWMSQIALEKQDPVKKAERCQQRKQKKEKRLFKKVPDLSQVLQKINGQRKRTHIPAHVKHSVMLRDGAVCQYIENNGKPCASSKWIEIHHRKEFSRGGRHSLENLVTLCSGHHKSLHQQQEVGLISFSDA